MAAIPLSNFVPNADFADPAGTAAGSTNIVGSAGVPLEQVVLRVVTATATTVLTVKAGANPPSLSAGQGDLAVSCTVGTRFIGPFTSARFMQADGTMNVNSATAANHTITAFRLPRTA